MTITSRLLALVLFSTLVATFSVTQASCTPDQAKQLEFGQPAPGFRIRVEFNEPLQGEQLVDRIQAVVNDLGFSPFRHPSSPEHAEVFRKLGVSDGKLIAPTYALQLADGTQQFRFRYVLGFVDSPVPRNGGAMASADFIFTSTFGESLSIAEWRYFCRLKSEILPGTFERGKLSIIRHPKLFTDASEAQRINAALGGSDCDLFTADAQRS